MYASKQESPYYDVCIIGAGPAGLACLSAVREPFSVDNLTELQFQRALHSIHSSGHHKLSVCVIDPESGWLHNWKTNFSQLRINHLRSPAMAHPDAFDKNALVAYACHRQREKKELYESGCADMKQLYGLGETQVGLWKLPSSKLFSDFCDDLVRKLPHKRLQGHVVDIQQFESANDTLYEITWSSSTSLFSSEKRLKSFQARNVIVATGMMGRPVIPPGLVDSPAVSWKDPHAFPAPLSKLQDQEPGRVLVVGGGLTAVQAALRVLQDGHKCVLCSRRPLQEKHFDIPLEWFDRRTANKNLSKIYHDTAENRLMQLKEARDGGSVPPMYMKLLQDHDHNLTFWTGDVEYQKSEASESAIKIQFQNSIHNFDRVILACGMSIDCSAHPLISKIMSKWPTPVHYGYPLLTEDLQWDTKHRNLFVVGAMAALQVGPDAGNLMGIRRAATVVANALDCRCWLREKALANPFDALLLQDDTSDTESENESICDCPSCDELE
eukprot:scaffold2243_cov165-Amphora_coffeaeformis.AAC.4